MFLNKLKIRSHYRNLLSLVLSVFVVFTASTEVYSTELTGDEILRNHQILQRHVDACYANFSENHYKTYFNPGHDRNFNFRGNINFCASGIQWLMKKTGSDEYIITPFTPFRGKTGKVLIFSNTSTYQWSGRELDHYQILSWPYGGKGNGTPHTQQWLDEKRTQFNQWRQHTAGIRFDKTIFPTLFPTASQKKNNKDTITEQEIQTDWTTTTEKYFRSLDKQSIEEYDALFSSQEAPINYLSTIPLWQEEPHSEPLFCWWVHKNLSSLQETIPPLEEYDPVCPIISLYTYRQTCLTQCEQVIQRCASALYAPLISFIRPYDRNKEIIIEVEGRTLRINSDFLGEDKRLSPSLMSPAIRLSHSNIMGMKKISKPDFVNWEIVEAFQPEPTNHLHGIKRVPIQFQLGGN